MKTVSQTALLRFAAGEGSFAHDGLSFGLFLKPQPHHVIALGGSRKIVKPLAAGMGWVYAPGQDGWCAWDNPSEVLFLNLAKAEVEALGGNPNVPARMGAMDPFITSTLHALHRAPTGNALYTQSLLQTLVLHTTQNLSPVNEPTTPRLARALDYLHAHLAENITLEQLADAAALSLFHFSRQFRQAYGLAPYQYLLKTRMEQASTQVAQTKRTMAEIAESRGQPEPCHSCRSRPIPE